MIIEVAAAPERNCKRAEIVGAYYLNVAADGSSRFWDRVPIDLKRDDRIASTEWQRSNCGGGNNARQCFRARQKLAIEIYLLLLRIFLLRQIECESQHAARIQPGVHSQASDGKLFSK